MYQCPECLKSFLSQNAINAHMRAHSKRYEMIRTLLPLKYPRKSQKSCPYEQLALANGLCRVSECNTTGYGAPALCCHHIGLLHLQNRLKTTRVETPIPFDVEAVYDGQFISLNSEGETINWIGGTQSRESDAAGDSGDTIDLEAGE